MRPADDDAHRLGLGLATLLMAIQLTERESDERRRARKQAVLHDKWGVLRAAFRDDLEQFQGYGGSGPAVRQLLDAFTDVTTSWTSGQRRALLVDALMADPFAPYELKVAVEHTEEAIGMLADALGLDGTDTTRLWEVHEAALTAYRPSRWRRPGQKVTTVPALTTGEFVLPPPPGSTADTIPDDVLDSDHHLALLGGGCLSATDAGMAGGLWLTAAPAGGADDRVRHLLALELAQIRTELVKVQMSHALIVTPGHAGDMSTPTVLAALDHLHEGVTSQLDEQRERNDEDAPRIRLLQEVLRAVELTRAGVEQVRDAGAAGPATATPAPQPAT